MPISKEDWDFMEEVAAYYRSTKEENYSEGSIRDTSIKFGINRNKVRKILITTGDIESPITKEALSLKEKGMSIKEIAKALGVSSATVSTALPYRDKIDNSLQPSQHAMDVREYRAYEREQMKRQAGHAVTKENLPEMWKGEVMEKEWQKDIKMSYTEDYHRPRRYTWEDYDRIRNAIASNEFADVPEEWIDSIESRYGNPVNKEDEEEFKTLQEKKELTEKEAQRYHQLSYKLGYYPGALNDRNRKELEKIAGNKLPPDPIYVIRLHLELYNEYPSDKDYEILKKYGRVEYGESISRDIIVPDDMPLYAIHYMIQRAFGWQNSHLHRFYLPEERFNDFANNPSLWKQLVGVVFRSPFMNEDDEFWADDYKRGSFKNWLRKKYTGPYLSRCYGEGLQSCIKDMHQIDDDEKYYVLYCTAYNRETKKYDGEEFVYDVVPVLDYDGHRNPEPKPWSGDETPYRVEIMKYKDVPIQGLKWIMQNRADDLLERLPIGSVLAAGRYQLAGKDNEWDRLYIGWQMVQSGMDLYNDVESEIDYILDNDLDSPMFQIDLQPITDVLLYNYDFGDNWKIRITASENCEDLVVSGRITQAELDRANVKCREVYRPVLIARDGDMVMDDVGGISGFVDFLQEIHPDYSGMDEEEKEDAKRERENNLYWAKSMGWHKDRSKNINLL